MMVMTSMYNFITITKIKIEFFSISIRFITRSRHQKSYLNTSFILDTKYICIYMHMYVYLYKVLKRACAATLDSNFVLLMVCQ